MVRILTTRRFRFYGPEGESIVSQGNRIIEDVPDWATKDDTFKAAENAGQLTRLEKAQKQQTKLKGEGNK